MDVCARMWLFTQGPLENAAGVSEACRPADEVKGFRVPHNSPLSIVHRESGHLRTKKNGCSGSRLRALASACDGNTLPMREKAKLIIQKQTCRQI